MSGGLLASVPHESADSLLTNLPSICHLCLEDSLTSDDVLYEHKWANDDALGLDHIDKRPNKVNAERGIVMK